MKVEAEDPGWITFLVNIDLFLYTTLALGPEVIRATHPCTLRLGLETAIQRLVCSLLLYLAQIVSVYLFTPFLIHLPTSMNFFVALCIECILNGPLTWSCWTSQIFPHHLKFPLAFLFCCWPLWNQHARFETLRGPRETCAGLRVGVAGVSRGIFTVGSLLWGNLARFRGRLILFYFYAVSGRGVISLL